MQRLTKPAALLLPLALLTGCAKNGAVIALTNCNVGNHVLVSKNDKITEETARDISTNNASREAAGCEARPNG